MANENVIPAGLPGYVMRKRIEDKATLHKGGMYVGTGEYETITDKKGNEYKVYKTEELPVGKEGQVLMSTVDGIKWEDPKNIVLNANSSLSAQQADESFLIQSEWNTGVKSLIEELNDMSLVLKRLYFLIQIQVVNNNTKNIYNLGFLCLCPRYFATNPLFYNNSTVFSYQTIEANNLIFELHGSTTGVDKEGYLTVDIDNGFLKEYTYTSSQGQISDVTNNYTIKWRQCK